LPMDDPTAEAPFSVRLAYLNDGWSHEMALRAIVEYKKYIFMCSVSDGMVTPSRVVDSVWHFHLLYTRSYKEMCNLMVGKDRFIHHEPSRGGVIEDAKFKGIYEKTTLKLYARLFGQPPEDIWGKYNPQQDPHAADLN